MTTDRDEWFELPMGAATATHPRPGTSVIKRMELVKNFFTSLPLIWRLMLTTFSNFYGLYWLVTVMRITFLVFCTLLKSMYCYLEFALLLYHVQPQPYIGCIAAISIRTMYVLVNWSVNSEYFCTIMWITNNCPKSLKSHPRGLK